MSKLIEYIASIIQTISALIVFVAHAITSLIRLFTHIPQYLAFITTSLDVLPTVIIPFVLASVTVYAVYFVLNKE